MIVKFAILLDKKQTFWALQKVERLNRLNLPRVICIHSWKNCILNDLFHYSILHSFWNKKIGNHWETHVNYMLHLYKNILGNSTCPPMKAIFWNLDNFLIDLFFALCRERELYIMRFITWHFLVIFAGNKINHSLHTYRVRHGKLFF